LVSIARVVSNIKIKLVKYVDMTANAKRQTTNDVQQDVGTTSQPLTQTFRESYMDRE